VAKARQPVSKPPATPPAAPAADTRRPPPRIAIILTGVLIGLAWGSLMWALVGRDSGARGWAYLAITMAMIGGGVAGIFGAVSARRRGERISPRVRTPFRRRG
jgi:fatty acid desaturase